MSRTNESAIQRRIKAPVQNSAYPRTSKKRQMTFATISSFLSIGRPGLPFRVMAMRSSLDSASIQSLISIVEDSKSAELNTEHSRSGDAIRFPAGSTEHATKSIFQREIESSGRQTAREHLEVGHTPGRDSNEPPLDISLVSRHIHSDLPLVFASTVGEAHRSTEPMSCI